jgi:hypothetical protein
VAPFRGPGHSLRRSTAGGNAPRWRPDGGELFYVTQDQRLMAVEVTGSGSTFEVGKTEALFSTNLLGNPLYDVSADGQHFLIAVPRERKSNEPLTLVQNWVAGPKK